MLYRQQPLKNDFDTSWKIQLYTNKRTPHPLEVDSDWVVKAQHSRRDACSDLHFPHPSTSLVHIDYGKNFLRYNTPHSQLFLLTASFPFLIPHCRHPLCFLHGQVAARVEDVVARARPVRRGVDGGNQRALSPAAAGETSHTKF